MIYTVTLNPSIDYVLCLDKFSPGKVNRAEKDYMYSGGKGIMASKLLKNLGEDPINLGFIGGRMGDFIRDELTSLGIREEFIRIEEDTRINIKLKADLESEINAKGPRITKQEERQLISQIKKLKKEDMVIISGSLPDMDNELIYIDIIKILKANNISFTIDTRGSYLKDSLKYNPFLIKPNKSELEELFKVNINTQADVVKYGKKCLELGAENVIVSLGKEGGIFLSKGEVYKIPGVKGRTVNNVGAGDSVVGGFIYGMLNGMDKKEAFKLGIASGTATAFSQDIGSKEKILEILENIRVETL